MNISIVFPESHDVQAWARDHALGLKPDRWPYGLNRLADAGNEWTVGARKAPAFRASSALSAYGQRTAQRRLGHTDVSVSWDEWTAARLLLDRADTRVYSGVIWATDMPERFKEKLKRQLVLAVLRKATRLWCLSRPQVEALRKELGAGSPPVDFVRFGVDADFFELRPFPEQPMVLSVGGDRHRDTRTLFSALSIVHSQCPDTEILVQTTSTLPPPPGVKVISRVPHVELKELYRRASVVAVATKPNMHVSGMTVSLEAMATGRPVVISHTPGVEDYVTEGDSGYLVPVGAAEDLAGGVLALLKDRHRAREMGERGRVKVEAEHTTKLMAASIRKLIGNGVGVADNSSD